MATTDNIITLHPAKPKTAAERAKAYRDRKRARQVPARQIPAQNVATNPPPEMSRQIPTENVAVPLPVSATPTLRPNPARIMLTIAAFSLAAVGVTMNGWFARSLGSSEIAGWLFLAIGVAADLVALAVPSCAAGLWHARQRGTALAGWTVWLMTFAFAVTAGIGFASVNIADVTLSRASRVTPAVEQARVSLSDAMTARDRECAGGVGKNCRTREETVTDRRRALDAAMLIVEHTADPQTEAASHIVAWLSLGMLRPAGDDFAMLRLILLALLPQIGGILLMIGRVRA